MQQLAVPAVVALASMAAQACFDEKPVRIDPGTRVCISDGIHVTDTVVIDLLVVVDNSASMAEEQAMLAGEFPALLRALLEGVNGEGERVFAPARDLHVGVVSTDMGSGGFLVETCEESLSGDDGVLLHASAAEGCDAEYPPYLDYDPGSWAAPAAGLIDAMVADFGCIAQVGTGGCGFEQPLEAARRALVDQARPGGANQGFLRPHSLLAILIVTDEDDCSAGDPTIYEAAFRGEGYPDQICQLEGYKLHAVERYVQDLLALRQDQGALVVGMLVGVPPGDPACNGRGSEIERCLDEEEMQVALEGTSLRASCSSPPGCEEGGDCRVAARPPRRLVDFARLLGENAVVASICEGSFLYALGALVERMREAIHVMTFSRALPMVKDARDRSGCRCIVPCRMTVELDDDRPCPEDLPAVDLDGDTLFDVSTDTEGGKHRVCEVPQAGSVLDDCGLDCADPAALLSVDPLGDGWWYSPRADPEGDGTTRPMIVVGDLVQVEHPRLVMHCCMDVCGEGRSCGSERAGTSRCCADGQYCYRPDGDAAGEGFCLVRPDVCESYGEDLWCPGAGLFGADPVIGGLCCLDPQGDGELDMADIDADGFLDTPLFRCSAGACVPR